MRKLWFIAILGTSVPAMAAESQIEPVYQFMKDNVATKKFRIEINQVLPTGIYSKFARAVIYSGLTRSDKELAFNIVFDVKQTVYDPKPDGTWEEVGTNKDRVGSYRCVLNEQRSTHEVIGNCHIIVNTIGDTAGAEGIRMKLGEASLTTTLLTVGYYSSTAPQGTSIPGRTRMVWDHSLVDGKTSMKENVFTWHVNPDTLDPTTEETASTSPTSIGE